MANKKIYQAPIQVLHSGNEPGVTFSARNTQALPMCAMNSSAPLLPFTGRIFWQHTSEFLAEGLTYSKYAYYKEFSIQLPVTRHGHMRVYSLGLSTGFLAISWYS